MFVATFKVLISFFLSASLLSAFDLSSFGEFSGDFLRTFGTLEMMDVTDSFYFENLQSESAFVGYIQFVDYLKHLGPQCEQAFVYSWTNIALDVCIPIGHSPDTTSFYMKYVGPQHIEAVDYMYPNCTKPMYFTNITDFGTCDFRQMGQVFEGRNLPPPPSPLSYLAIRFHESSCDSFVLTSDQIANVTNCEPSSCFNPHDPGLNLNISVGCVPPTLAPSAVPTTLTLMPLANPSVNTATPSLRPVSTSSSPSSCFAGSETVMLASGVARAISEIAVGDEIAVAAMDGSFAGYSPVIAVPHAKNSMKAAFAQINTVSGRGIKMTADHLVLGGACAAPSLVQAGSLKAGECVQTVSGAEAIVSISTVETEGIYTVITKHDGLLIVNGIIASPFAVNHLVTNSFYNIARVMYDWLPSVAKAQMTSFVIQAFGDVVTTAAVFA